MGRPDGAHTHGHGHGGGGSGLNGFCDMLNQYVLLPIAAVCLVASFMHFILIALLCIGALAVGYVAAYVAVVRWGLRRARQYELPPAPARPMVTPAPARRAVDGQTAGQIVAADVRRVVLRALTMRGPR